MKQIAAACLLAVLCSCVMPRLPAIQRRDAAPPGAHPSRTLRWYGDAATVYAVERMEYGAPDTWIEIGRVTGTNGEYRLAVPPGNYRVVGMIVDEH